MSDGADLDVRMGVRVTGMRLWRNLEMLAVLIFLQLAKLLGSQSR